MTHVSDVDLVPSRRYSTRVCAATSLTRPARQAVSRGTASAERLRGLVNDEIVADDVGNSFSA